MKWPLELKDNVEGRPSVDFPTAGFLPPQTLPNTMVTKQQQKSRFREFLKKKDHTVPYQHMQGTYMGILKSNERYRVSNITKHDDPNFARNMKFMKSLFEPWKGSCNPHDLKDVEYNPKGAAGSVFKSRGYTNKKQVVEHFPDLIHWSLDWQHKIGLIPLCRESGKSEILPQEKIDKGIPRTFIFSDTVTTLNMAQLLSGIKDLFSFNANKFGKWPFRLCSSFIKGRFNKFVRMMEGLLIAEGDCSKWDANMRRICQSAAFELYAYLLPDQYHERLKYFEDVTFDSYVVLPNGQVITLPGMKSGRADTTMTNCIGHLYILIDHFLDVCELENWNPHSEWLRVNFNIYADDHLNAYPQKWRKYISYEIRSLYYLKYGQQLHPPPLDKVHEDPVGATFLGAKISYENLEYVPEYSTERLLAILYCRDFTDEELEEILVSISPLVCTNEDALSYYKSYVLEYFPHLLHVITDRSIFSGRESAAVGQKLYVNRKQTSFINEIYVSRSTLGQRSSNMPNNHPASIDSISNRRKRRPRQRNRGANSKPQSPTTVSTVRQNTGMRAASTQMLPAGRSTLARPNSNRVRASTANRVSIAPVRPPGRSDKMRQQLYAKVHHIVASLLYPEGATSFLWPDGARNLSLYNSKQTTEVLGASDTTGSNLAGSDQGRFAVFYNPIITELDQFGLANNQSQLVTIDGGDQDTAWPKHVVPTTMSSRVKFTADPLQTRFTGLDGTMDRARCAGASMLITFDGDNFGGGGRIAGKCLPASMWAKRCTNTLNNNTSITEYENMAGQIPEVYNGKLVDGIYCWWRPDDMKDMEFRSPTNNTAKFSENMSQYPYPVLGASGFINQSGGLGVKIKNSMQVNCYTNFNYTTNDRSQPGLNADDCPEAIAAALSYLKNVPTSWENIEHEKWISALLGGVAGFILGGPLGAVAGAATGYGINPGAFAKR